MIHLEEVDEEGEAADGVTVLDSFGLKLVSGEVAEDDRSLRDLERSSLAEDEGCVRRDETAVGVVVVVADFSIEAEVSRSPIVPRISRCSFLEEGELFTR